MTYKDVVANDGKIATLQCPLCGAQTSLIYTDKDSYLKELKSPCRRCGGPKRVFSSAP